MIRRAALLPLLILSLAACDIVDTGPDLNLSVSSVSPANGASDVPLDETVRATLEPSDSTITSVGNQTVTLTQTGTDNVVAATVTTTGNTVTLDPTDALSASTSYTFAISTEVKDQNGAALASAYSSTFTTGTEETGPTNPEEEEPPKTAALEASADQLIFEAQNSQTSQPQTVTFTNTGNAPFTLSSLEPSNSQFSLTNAPSLPAEIAPSDSVEVAVTFQPTELGPQTALLNANGSPLTVGLRGLSVQGEGGDLEPSLQWILDTFNLSISTGDDDPSTTAIATPPEDSQARRNLFNSTLGDEVPLQRFQKAGSGDVTIEVLAAYGVDNTPVTEFGWYEISADNEPSLEPLFEVESGASNAQTLNPTTDGDLSFDPGTTSFGFYSFWPTNDFFRERNVYTQDELNTFPSAIPHQMRAYPYKAADGVIEPNTYVLATEEFSQGYDYNDIVVVVRNVRPSTEDPFSCNQGEPITASRVLSQSVGGGLELQNPSGAPFADRLVFSRVGKISGNFGESRIEPFVDLQCHDLNVLRLKNTSGSTLNISNISISGEDSSAFVLPNGENSLSIGAGDTEDLLVQFVEDGDRKGLREANLQMQTSAGSLSVQLSGIYQFEPEGGRELYLEQVVEAFGYSTDVDANRQGGLSSAEPESPNAGDEVRSKLWQQAGSGPVYVRQLAAFHSCCKAQDAFEIFANGTSVASFASDKLYGQSVLPPRSGSETQAAELSTQVSGPFEIKVAGYSTDWTGNKKNNNNLGVRLWPAKRNGETVPNTYIVAQDFVENGCGTSETANCDFNDNMYLITNVSPVSPE